jgi:NAD(P)-dependent dehydrogenase (short-subunit alcohol dehydrogenase family)
VSALVTGASGGVGAAVATALAAAGHDVAVHHRHDAAGARATAAAVEAHGRRAALLRAELAVADPAQMDAVARRLLDEAETALGPLDVVVLNAAAQQVAPWDELDTAAWDALQAAGVRQSFALLHTAGARLRPGSVVVTVGSIEGLRAAPGHAAYAAGKAALHALTAAAAAELGPRGVRVVAVAPGLVDRPGLADDWPEGVARWSAAAALGRPVTPDEVAATVAFLASPAASGITGTTVLVDAGWSAAPGW